MPYAESDNEVKQEIVGRWLAVKRGNAGFSREVAASRLEIETANLRSIEEGSLDQLTFLFEKMMSLYEISEFEVLALQRDVR